METAPCGSTYPYVTLHASRKGKSLGRLIFAASCAALLVVVLVAAVPAQQMPPGMTPEVMKMMMTPGKAHPPGVPADAKPWFGCIPTMGYHYVSDKNKPFGPVYGWYDGKPVFTEIMVTKKLFDAGTSWNQQLKPLPGYQIDHTDFWWEPKGHPGYPIPHYDIHAWYVPHSVHMYYCNNKSGKKPAFL